MTEEKQNSTESVISEEEKQPDIQEKEPSAEERLQTELQEYKDKYMRLLAESENARKRLQKEKIDMVKFSTENVMSEFLAPIDNLENALKFAGQASEETANWAKGFEMILGQFLEVLSSNGVTPFASVGASFDPHHHEAVEVEVSDTQEAGLILEEYVKGYKSKDRVIRPARVKVVKKPAPPEKENVSESETNQETLEKE